MKRLRSSAIKHCHRFLNKFDGIRPEQRVLVSVSGGRDSMFCLWLYHQFFKEGLIHNAPVVLYFDHKLRSAKDHQEDEKLIKEYCRLHHLKMLVKTADDFSYENKKRNVEKQARRWRYLEYEKLKNHYDVIVLGHHIDDSLEWSLLSQLRGGDYKNSLGIPVKRGAFLRPLMCFTRDQISNLVTSFKIPYRDDHSNNDLQFERNFLRHTILPKLKKRYGNIQRNYVHQKNALAFELGLSIFGQKENKIKDYIFKGEGESFFLHPDILKNSSIEEIKNAVIQVMIELDGEGRSKSRKELEKLICAWRSGKQGPWQLSANVSVYSIRRHLWIMTNQTKNKIASQIPKLITSQKQRAKKSAIGRTITVKWLKAVGGKKNALKRHPLFQELINESLKSNIYIEPIFIYE